MSKHLVNVYVVFVERCDKKWDCPRKPKKSAWNISVDE